MKSAAVVVALLAGIVVGFGLSRLRSSDVAPPPPTAPPPLEAAPSRPDAPSRGVEALEVEVRRLREENERLRSSSTPAPPSPAVSEASRRERAKSIFETFRRAFVDKDAQEMLKAIGAIDELDQSMTRYFIERHRAGIEHRELRHMNLMLVQLSGGSEASAFLLELVRDRSVDERDRDTVLRNLSGTGIPENRKLPYDGAVAAAAETLLASNEGGDRMAGAGLLGGNDSDASRVRLLRMAQSDPDSGVRAAAIASLGWVGDRAAYERLKGFKVEAGEKTALERALAQLKRRFPE